MLFYYQILQNSRYGVITNVVTTLHGSTVNQHHVGTAWPARCS